METLPYAQVREPFGKINYVCQPDGSRQVRAYLLHQTRREGARSGVALQASRTMRIGFGFVGWRGRWLGRRTGTNAMSLLAQRMCSYLARKVDANGSTAAIYWATGPSGDQVEEIGDLTAYQSERYDFAGPRHLGARAELLPALRYYVERFSAAPWGLYVFITDGNVQDLDAVQRYTQELAQAVSQGKRSPLKLVLLGLGSRVDRSNLQQLDDLRTEVGIDLWDHRLAVEMRGLLDIFAETVDENTIIADRGTVRDAAGQIVRVYDQGLPALLVFTLPGESSSFTLEMAGESFTQPLL